MGINTQNNVKHEIKLAYKENLVADEIILDSVSSNEIQVNYSTEWPPYYDTILTEANFLTEEYGYYEIQHQLVMDSTDASPENNSDSYNFIINDSTYSRCSNIITGTVSTEDFINAGYVEDGIGVLYTLTTDETEVKAIRWYFDKSNIEDFSDYIEYEDYIYTTKLLRYSEETESWCNSAIISSEVDTITLADTGVWITTDFITNGFDEFIEAGNYLAFLKTSITGPLSCERPEFRIGEDRTIPQPGGIAYLYRSFVHDWLQIDANPSIQLIIASEDWEGNNGVGVEKVKIDKRKKSFLSQNYPNPAKDYTEIKYRLTESSHVNFQFTDLTGKLVKEMNEGYKTAGNYVTNVNVQDLKPGVYYYTLKTEQFKETRKMIITK